MTATAATASYVIVRWMPNYRHLLFAQPSYGLAFFQILTVKLVMWAFWSMFWWPMFFSPLRHLPSPKVQSVLNLSVNKSHFTALHVL